MPELQDSGKYRILRVGNFFNSDKWYYSDLELPPEKYCEEGDLLFAWSCSFGPKIWHGEKTIYHYHIWKLVEDKDIVDRKWLYYWLMNSVAHMTASNHGSVMMHMTKAEMESLEITLPPLATQQRIAAVLGALDDKIELNRKMNANLEAQAQALFKSWFVDFEPFGGKMPDGWKKGRFADLIGEMFNGDWGKDEPEKNNQAPVYCIRGADIPNVRMGEIGKMPLRYILPKNLNKKKLVDHDLVVEIAGGSPTQSTGRVAIVRNLLLSKYPHDLICTNFCKAVRPRENFGIYLYLAWIHAYNLKHYFQYENGTTGIKNLDISALIDNEEIVVPDTETVDDFNAIVGKCFDLIYCNSSESRKLAETRDALLPKLMKGEIEV